MTQMIAKPRCLVLGARAPAALEWIRAFRAAKVTVFAADSLRWPLCRAARGIAGYVRLPEPRADVNEWGRVLLKFVVQQRIDYILPTCEEVFYLSHQLSRFPYTVKIFTMPLPVLRNLHHKGLFAKATKDWALSSPETHLLSSPAESESFKANCHEWVFKPAFSRFASQTLIRPTAAKLSSIAPTAEQPWVAQRFVDGKEYCSFSILVAGNLVSHACYHPKYRVGTGSGIFFEHIVSADIEDFVKKFGREFNYTGQVGFDFIEGADGFKVLECNPRATSGIHLYGKQRRDLVATLLGEATDVLKPIGRNYNVAFAMAAIGTYRYGAKKVFWQDFRQSTDAIFSFSDPKPLFIQVFSVGEILFRAVRSRSGILPAATRDIEWDGNHLGSVQA